MRIVEAIEPEIPTQGKGKGAAHEVSGTGPPLTPCAALWEIWASPPECGVPFGKIVKVGLMRTPGIADEEC
jgi:hypothetical protein